MHTSKNDRLKNVWVCATGRNKSRGGKTADLKGVNVAVTAYVNGEPRTQLELLEGFQKIPFGTGEASFSNRL